YPKQFEDLWDIGAAGTGAWANADTQSGKIVNRVDGKTLRRRELKCGVVHREYHAHRAIPGALRPIGPVPALQRHSHGDEAEHGFLLLHQNDVLCRTLRHLCGRLDMRCAADNPTDTLAITVIDSTGRSGPNRDRTRPIDLFGRGYAAADEDRCHD